MNQSDKAMHENPITFLSEGHQIVGMLHLPEQSDQRVLILCHGLGGNKVEGNRIFVEAARRFSEKGYAVLRFDFYGSGDSEGEFQDTTISHNVENLKDAIKFVRAQDYTKVCVLGLSLGAATAILTMADEPYDSLITCSAVADTRSLFDSRAPESIKKNEDIQVYEHDGWQIRRRFWEDALRYDVLRSFSTIKIPKLILQGDADDAPFLEGFKALQRIASPPCEFYIFPGVGHTFKNSKDRNHFYQIVLRWLRTKLQ